jgi:Holliday junction resolvasome RuvABC ATP-dependent DNA helicase subunit|tara:strand:+ start:23053 stop:23982 length:930 start_codon:yes stop_codon:yes gene_type:complete
MKNNYFPDLVGQDSVKKKLSFYLDAFHKTSQAPFLLMAGAKGLGKTEFAKGFATNLKNQDGEKRAFVELNCSTIKNNEMFFEQIFMPLIADNDICILFDECHALPTDLTMAFLTIFNTEANSRKIFTWNEMNFEFNFKQQTFIFATTETDKIFPPLKDRLTSVDFEAYNEQELGEIIKICAPDIEFDDDCLKEVASTIRGNARSAVKRAKEISLYCGAKESNHFSLDNFRDLSDNVGILPFGLSNTEKQILQILKKCGSATLTGLSAKLGLSKTALQRDHELYLLNKSLIEIDGKRKITPQGRQLCKAL